MSEWRDAPARILDAIERTLDCPELVVRSSAIAEDSLATSNAGRFESVLGVDANDPEALGDAIKRVLASFGEGDPLDRVLVQPMLEDVVASGVVMTHDSSSLAPYYVVNYDVSTTRTDTVTSGSGASLETYYLFRDTATQHEEPLPGLIGAVAEIEEVLGSTLLDVEFAVTADGGIVVLQARPIAVGERGRPDIDLGPVLEKVRKKADKLCGPHPHLLGSTSYFGVMPDWNPAEMIGLRPRRLALSLYKDLITDRTWAYQRHKYGYRDLRSFPLLVAFAGAPYIDLRVDFNSFLPAALDDTTAAKLVDHYLASIRRVPEAHDKIEFQIVHSCYHLGLPDGLDELRSAGFTGEELDSIRESLLVLTNRILHAQDGLLVEDLERIRELERRQASVRESTLPVLDRIYWLAEDCRRYGTLPFAGIARCAFVAVQLLDSLVRQGLVTAHEREDFMISLSTVARDMGRDLARLARDDTGRDEFLDRYGHLRPGTYDILSPRYDEDFDAYFSNPAAADETETRAFSLGSERMAAIDTALSDHGLEIDGTGLFAFIAAAIEGREWAKFVFTRSVSDILVLLERLGARYGLDRDDLSHLDFVMLLALYAQVDHRDLGDILRADIATNREYHAYTRQIRLPQVMFSPNDVYGFHLEKGEPTFISMGRVTGPVRLVSHGAGENLEGSVACIESADPGYDWLFSRGIAGLVTMFGGANSHMGIRCAELGLPAVIGAGEQNFSAWSAAETLEIDAANRRVVVVS